MNYKYQIGSVVFDNWSIKRKIGEGSFGRVFEIEREDFGQAYHAALKVITVPQNESELRGAIEEGMTQAQAEQYFYSVVEDIVREFALMARLKGTANVVSYEDHTVIKHNDEIGWDILIRMELLNPLLPYAYAHPFSRRDVIRLGIDMCKALELCQKYNIIHRDIKPENIFVSDNGDFKLGDFGIARTVEKTMSGLSKKGTYNYMAPEVYRGTEYGFSVDIYSLGIVLYRLLNKNRIPFLPPAPEPITYSKREIALAKRMGGEEIPIPFYAEGRLGEIVRKACSFHSKDRYDSPMQMRQELEAILYDAEDAEYIYPDGDELAIIENQYISKTPEDGDSLKIEESIDKTQAIFFNPLNEEKSFEESKTESIFKQDAPALEKTSTTESIFSSKTLKEKNKEEIPKKNKTVKKIKEESTVPQKEKKHTATIIGIIIVGFILGTGIILINGHSKTKRYQALMEEAATLCDTNPEDAAEKFLEAQKLKPKEVEAHISYAYALYCGQKYDDCINYIENELNLGKAYDVTVQNKLSEILGAAYFEQGDYAAAAGYFRMSVDSDDITVSAMRDYAVSLGRLGDIQAADEVLKRMTEAGAKNDELTYVQAEVDFALKQYVDAERGFKVVLNTTDNFALQKRALRSLAEVYRECSKLERSGNSPITSAATLEVEVLVDGMDRYNLQHDSTIWEMLAMAYYEAYRTDDSVPQNYLKKAAECFNRVLDMGVKKDYLYSNLYTIYYELGDFTTAGKVLDDYQETFPNEYMPHALRGMMLITIENKKPQSSRNYTKALTEYNQAKEKLKSDDDTTYYQQLGSLIEELKTKGGM